MTPQQIKAKAPEGATHYAEVWPHITYLKNSKFGWLYHNGMTWFKFDSNFIVDIKPL